MRGIVIARSFETAETFASVASLRTGPVGLLNSLCNLRVKRLRQPRSSCSRLYLIEGFCDTPLQRFPTGHSFPKDGFKFIHSDYNWTPFHIRTYNMYVGQVFVQYGVEWNVIFSRFRISLIQSIVSDQRSEATVCSNWRARWRMCKTLSLAVLRVSPLASRNPNDSERACQWTEPHPLILLTYGQSWRMLCILPEETGIVLPWTYNREKISPSLYRYTAHVPCFSSSSIQVHQASLKIIYRTDDHRSLLNFTRTDRKLPSKRFHFTDNA